MKLRKNILAFVGIFLLLVIEGLIDMGGNISAADRTNRLLLDQTVNVLESNDEEEAILVDSLKEDYITRAKAVAYTIQKDNTLAGDADALMKIADLMSVDEIHLFDKAGTLYAGTNPEYYGITMDDGPQISYFKQILDDQTLSLCQDLTPNSAENKQMMYAMVWMEDGSCLVQIGISPERLLSEINHHEISQVVDSMPMSDGVEIVIADTDTGEIYGATTHDYIGQTLKQVGIKKIVYDKAQVKNIGHERYRTLFTSYDTYEIGVLYSSKEIHQGLFVNLLIMFLYLVALLTVGQIIYGRIKREEDKARQDMRIAQEEREQEMEVLESMSKMYTSMHLIDLEKQEVKEYGATDAIRAAYIETDDVATLMKNVMIARSSQESMESILEFCDLHTIRERMRGCKSIYRDFLNVENKWSRANFIVIRVDANGCPTSLIYAVQMIDEQKRKEESLLLQSNTDELTGCFNRRAYEEDTAKLERDGFPEDLLLAAMDVNGLKQINDTLGHGAGDELICGAASCLKAAFTGYGKLYRTGGDEFMAILSVRKEQQERIAQLVATYTAEWTGQLVQELTLSYGFARASQLPGASIHQLEKAADADMYKAKEAYYSTRGVDRRGQAVAYQALCNSYLKVLKTDLTRDSYLAVKTDERERLPEGGLEESLSKWMKSFGASGQVAQEDLEEYFAKTDLEYLKREFDGGKEKISFSYKRRVEDTYKDALMEMVRDQSYSPLHRVIYIYVKDIVTQD